MPTFPALGAITAIKPLKWWQAGLKAIYGSGWQVAADGKYAGDVYPDQSLYPCDSAPNLVKRINRALAARGSNRVGGRKEVRNVLDGLPNCRGRRSRFWRIAQRL